MSTLKDAAVTAKTNVPTTSANFTMNERGVVTNTNSFSVTTGQLVAPNITSSGLGIRLGCGTGTSIYDQNWDKTWYPTTVPQWPQQPTTFDFVKYLEKTPTPPTIKDTTVNITVHETMDGYVGQIQINVSGQNVIVWESEPFDADDFTTEATKRHPATDGTLEASNAARDAAKANAKRALRKLFK